MLKDTTIQNAEDFSTQYDSTATSMELMTDLAPQGSHSVLPAGAFAATERLVHDDTQSSF